MYKPGHSVAVNSAWFSSHSYVEDRRQPDLWWVAMAVLLLLFNGLLIFLLLHGKFYGLLCYISSWRVNSFSSQNRVWL